jgi:hypothetical protein
MDKLMVENMEIDIEKQLSEYRELARKRDLFDERIRRTEAEKASVKPHIYEKVCKEYREALDGLTKEIEPVELAVEKTRNAVAAEIEDIESQMGDLQDQLDELTFRHLVGEFEQAALEQKETPLNQNIEKLKTKIHDLKTTVKRLSLDEESSDETPDLNSGNEFVVDPFPEPEALATDERTLTGLAGVLEGSKNAGEDSDFVDPSDWVGEFVNEETFAPTDDPDNTDTVAPAQVADGDGMTDDNPLASLADPSDDKDAGTNDDRNKAASQPYDVDELQGFPFLTITKGAGAGKKLPLLPMTMTLGREHDNNIELKDTDVSRYHARISFERGEYVIEDLEGSSGTWVNEEKIDRSPLFPGDTIRAGSTELKIELE